MRYKIRLSYDGSAFCGWQIQNNAATVQGEIEKSLSTLLGTEIQITGAGRTDSEVNAINYIAHFDAPDEGMPESEHLRYKMNAILPHEIAVHEVVPCGQEFHARFDAQSREYHYFIHFVKDPFCERFSYRMRYPLDIEKMNEAAESTTSAALKRPEATTRLRYATSPKRCGRHIVLPMRKCSVMNSTRETTSYSESGPTASCAIWSEQSSVP